MVESNGNGAVCSECGVANKPGARFCAGCGKSLGLACANCGASLKAGARFCAGCGQAVDTVAVASPAPAPAPAVAALAVAPASAPTPARYVGQLSADGQWRWDGTQWAAVTETAPGGASKAKKGKNPVLIAVLVVVAAAFLFFVGMAVMRSVTNGGLPTPSPARTLGPGPYYLHFNCGADTACEAVFGVTTASEAVANNGKTGVYEDSSDKAGCDQLLAIVTSSGNTWWCSTSKSPGDTGP